MYIKSIIIAPAIGATAQQNFLEIQGDWELIIKNTSINIKDPDRHDADDNGALQTSRSDTTHNRHPKVVKLVTNISRDSSEKDLNGSTETPVNLVSPVSTPSSTPETPPYQGQQSHQYQGQQWHQYPGQQWHQYPGQQPPQYLQYQKMYNFVNSYFQEMANKMSLWEQAVHIQRLLEERNIRCFLDSLQQTTGHQFTVEQLCTMLLQHAKFLQQQLQRHRQHNDQCREPPLQLRLSGRYENRL